MLPGSTHKTVVIYVNGKKSLTVPVADEAALEAPKSAKSSKMPPSSTELAGGGLLVVLEASATVTSAKRCWFAVGKSNLVHVNLLSS